jgi:hypothetical protein
MSGMMGLWEILRARVSRRILPPAASRSREGGSDLDPMKGILAGTVFGLLLFWFPLAFAILHTGSPANELGRISPRVAPALGIFKPRSPFDSTIPTILLGR